MLQDCPGTGLYPPLILPHPHDGPKVGLHHRHSFLVLKFSGEYTGNLFPNTCSIAIIIMSLFPVERSRDALKNHVDTLLEVWGWGGGWSGGDGRS